ncbi:MAG: AbrB/MazE/SpoVT family DNA-binding domain-containing protein [Actinomycetota bacterium]|nr:MAG: AbrB/MazE/SpoVT family DNA-binding domain-containing protein [Actinomycetota bacterium]
MKASVLSNKGWVVIPNSIRKRYGLKRGDQVNIIDYGDVISIIPLSTDPVKDSAGLLKGGSSLTKDLIEQRKRDKELGK